MNVITPPAHCLVLASYFFESITNKAAGRTTTETIKPPLLAAQFNVVVIISNKAFLLQF